MGITSTTPPSSHSALPKSTSSKAEWDKKALAVGAIAVLFFAGGAGLIVWGIASHSQFISAVGLFTDVLSGATLGGIATRETGFKKKRPEDDKEWGQTPTP